jgi:hypothetical protein
MHGWQGATQERLLACADAQGLARRAAVRVQQLCGRVWGAQLCGRATLTYVNTPVLQYTTVVSTPQTPQRGTRLNERDRVPRSARNGFRHLTSFQKPATAFTTAFSILQARFFSKVLPKITNNSGAVSCAGKRKRPQGSDRHCDRVRGEYVVRPGDD